MSAHEHCCALCHQPLEAEEAAILTMGHYGNPRYLCNDCAAVLDLLTESREPGEIRTACERLAGLLAASDTDDTSVMETVEQLLENAAARADAIEDGTYVEPSEGDGMDDIPEELRETEEDRAQDEREAEASQRFDRIWTWVITGVMAVAAVLIVLRFTVWR